MEKHSLVRTIYLYLFALVGLTLLVIGTVRFVDMGLKAFVFTKAEQAEKVRQEYKHYFSFLLSLIFRIKNNYKLQTIDRKYLLY